MRKCKRRSRKTKRIAVISDLHCGHAAGLTHPDYQLAYPDTKDDASVGMHKTRRKRQERQRKTLWDWFDGHISAFQPFDILVVNADAIDGKGRRSGSTEQITADRNEQVEMATAAIEHVISRDTRTMLTYGTRYHVSEDGEDYEDNLATALGATIHGEIHLDVNGLVFAIKHKIGGSKSPVSRYTALSNAQLRQELWALRGQQPKANVIVRSHVHRCLYVGEPGTNSYVITTPALQGLGSKYGIREVDGLPVEFGFIVFDVESAGNYSCTQVIASLEMQKASVTKV